MPDLKSEMSKVLEAWEQDDQQTQEKPMPKNIFQPINNVTLETFNYVRDNPNKNSGEIRSDMTKRGFNAGSVGSLITQFTKQGQFEKDHNGRYRAIVREYTPLKSTKKFRAEGKRANKIVSTKPKTKATNVGIAALNVDTTNKQSMQWDADTIINNIGLKQARALYDELKKIFGG
jgi:transcriptional/translational regulatory protein YebC/TACO1